MVKMKGNLVVGLGSKVTMIYFFANVESSQVDLNNEKQASILASTQPILTCGSGLRYQKI
jgi:hypothetical protein